MIDGGSLLTFALWGGFGGVAIELVEILGAIKRVGGLPWKYEDELPLAGLILTVLIRIGLGVGLAVALAQSDQISGPIGAVAAGVGAPLILEQMAKQAGDPTGKLPARRKTGGPPREPDAYWQPRKPDQPREPDGYWQPREPDQPRGPYGRWVPRNRLKEALLWIGRSTPAFGVAWPRD